MTRSIRNCNVAVVGGAGFLGSHLVNHLIEDRNCNVTVVDNLISGRREFIHPKAMFVYHDITESEEYILRVFRQGHIQFVFNYAAEPYIPVSFERPLHVFNINAFGALKVINAAQEAGCEGILQVSSAEIYGNDKYEPGDLNRVGYPERYKLNENAPVQPHSSYGVAKAAIDSAVQVRWREAKTPVIALRQFNCVGERETHPYVIPEIISQLHACQQRSIRPIKYPSLSLGNNSFRDFQYAGDAVRMATELLEKGEFGQVYNMGSEGGIKIYDLALLIARLMGIPDVQIIPDESRKRPWEIWHLQSDNTKLYNVIESRPRTSLEDALRLTIGDFNGKWCWE